MNTFTGAPIMKGCGFAVVSTALMFCGSQTAFDTGIEGGEVINGTAATSIPSIVTTLT